MIFYTSKAPSTDAITPVKFGPVPGPGGFICLRCGKSFTARVTLVKISSVSIKVMLESVYTSKVFPAGIGPHWAFTPCAYLRLYSTSSYFWKSMLSLLWSSPCGLSSGSSSKRKPGYCFSRRGRWGISTNKAHHHLGWLSLSNRGKTSLWKKCWLERELCCECWLI